MKYSIPGLGGRLQRARKATGLSQEAVAKEVGISWMTVHRWERFQRGVPDQLLDRVSEIYNRPLAWFLTLEDGDLVGEQPTAVATGHVSDTPTPHSAGQEAAERIRLKIANAPAADRPMIERVVEDMLDGLARSERR